MSWLIKTTNVFAVGLYLTNDVPAPITSKNESPFAGDWTNRPEKARRYATQKHAADVMFKYIASIVAYLDLIGSDSYKDKHDGVCIFLANMEVVEHTFEDETYWEHNNVGD